MCSVPAVGSRRWEGPSEDVLCQFDVFDVDVVLGDASAYFYWVVGFWEVEMSFRICSVLGMSSWMHYAYDFVCWRRGGRSRSMVSGDITFCTFA